MRARDLALAAAALAYGFWAAVIWHGRTGLPPSAGFGLTWVTWSAATTAALLVAGRVLRGRPGTSAVAAAAVGALLVVATGLSSAIYVSTSMNHALDAAAHGPGSARPLALFAPPLAVLATVAVWMIQRRLRSPQAMAAAALGVVALGLGVAATNWALPAIYHPDEANWVWNGVNMVSTADLNPDYFFNPSLYPYTLAGLFAPYYWVARWIGTFGSPDDMQVLFGHQPARFVIAARVENALLAAALVALTYAIGRRIIGAWPAVAAAAIVATSLLVTRAAHHATTDVLATVLGTAVLALAVAADRRPQWRTLIGAAVLIGLATGTKYNAALAAVPILVVVLRRWPALSGSPGGRFARAAALPVIALAAFVVSTPFAVLDWSTFATQVVSQSEQTGARIAWGQSTDPTWWLATTAMLQGAGWAVTILAVLGLVPALRRRSGWILLVYAAVNVVAIVAVAQFRVRFLLPLMPVAGIWAVAGIAWLASHRLRVHPAVAVAATLAVVAQPLAYSLWHDVMLGRTDTRTIALSWVRTRVQPGTTIGVDAFSILDTRLNTWEINPDDPTRPVQSTVLVTDWKDATLDQIRARGIRYAVVSSYVYERYVRSGFRPQRPLFYRALESDADVVAIFGPGPHGTDVGFDQEEVYTPFWHLFDRERPGPTITVYRLP